MNAITHELQRRWPDPVQGVPFADYVNWRIDRYRNQELNDTIGRLCREPLRKLSPRDRLLGPVRYIQRYADNLDGDSISAILVGVVGAMDYAVVNGEHGDYAALRAEVLEGLEIDSSLLQRAEDEFGDLKNQ